VIGKDGDTQRSVIVTGINEEQVAEPWKKDQVVVALTRKGLVDMDGRLVPATGVEEFHTPPEDSHRGAGHGVPPPAQQP